MRGKEMLKGKKIVLGITGGIAAYKAAELTRECVKREASVRVIMTKNAAEFITPLTLQTLSGHPVFMDMYVPMREFEMVSYLTCGVCGCNRDCAGYGKRHR